MTPLFQDPIPWGINNLWSSFFIFWYLKDSIYRLYVHLQISVNKYLFSLIETRCISLWSVATCLSLIFLFLIARRMLRMTPAATSHSPSSAMHEEKQRWDPDQENQPNDPIFHSAPPYERLSASPSGFVKSSSRCSTPPVFRWNAGGLFISLETILLIKIKWSNGQRRMSAYSPQGPMIPRNERRVIPARGIRQHRTIQKRWLLHMSRFSSVILKIPIIRFLLNGLSFLMSKWCAIGERTKWNASQ